MVDTEGVLIPSAFARAVMPAPDRPAPWHSTASQAGSDHGKKEVEDALLPSGPAFELLPPPGTALQTSSAGLCATGASPGHPQQLQSVLCFHFLCNERCGHDAEHPAQWSPTATLHRREHGHQHSHLAVQDGHSLSIFPFLPCFFSPVRAQQLQPCDSHFVLSSCWWYFGAVAEQALCPLQSRLRLPHCCSASCSAARPGQLRGGQQELEEFVLLETTSLR